MRIWTVWVGVSALLLSQALAPAAMAQGQTLIMFDFEGTTDEWSIPDWATANTQDYVGASATNSPDYASHGEQSLQVLANFPGGGRWTGAYVERVMYVTDWTQFGQIAADLYLPYNAPKGLKARVILGTGEQWTWTEMNRALPLEPDRWTTITANLKPGSLDWKFFPDDLFRKDVRKVGIRIESDHEPAYQGPVFIDQIRLVK